MILIVDDHPDLREMLVKFLKKDGLESVAVASGEEALLDLQTFQPRLILLDYGMPGMNGLDVFREMKKNARLAAIPVILFSAHGADLMEAALAEGISSFVQKGSLDWLKLRKEIIRLTTPVDAVPHEPSASERINPGRRRAPSTIDPPTSAG